MTNREKIVALKKIQTCREEISNLLEQIVHYTYDYHCDGIHDFRITDDKIFVDYEWCCRGEHGRDECSIPIEWLNEGFDYMAAYEEKCRQAELARIRNEENEKKRLENLRKYKAKLKKEQEYKKYLALKKKYEGGAE